MNSPAWNPFREMEELLDRYSRSTGRAMPGVYDELSAPAWAPCTDVEETAEMYQLRAELPGVLKQDISVCFHGDTLEISGEKRADMKSEQGSRRHRSECFFGDFCRAFNLPHNLDASAAQADYADGVLTVRIPKTRQSDTHVHRLDVN